MTSIPRQPINVPYLENYLKANVAQISVPISLKQFAQGQSNPTYQITAQDGRRYVLRKKPPGSLVSKAAHKIEREYRVMKALHCTAIPVPAVYCFCSDESIIGTAFYIMDFLDGRIFEDPEIPSVTPPERHEMWRDATRTLAALHRVDIDAVGLRDFGRRSGFYERQMSTLRSLADAQALAIDVKTGVAVGQIPHLDKIVEYFKNTQPDERVRLVHGDFKIDNLVFHPVEPKVIGILDWELSTLGHPLSDIVNLTVPYLDVEPALGPGRGRGAPEFVPGATLGLPSREEVIKWYVEDTQWEAGRIIAWGDAFGMFRSTVIVHGIAARYARRQGSGISAQNISKQVVPFVNLTLKLVGKAEEKKRLQPNL